jgi:methylated-DNA-[protein]-cysteine S-methyltransferase
MNTDPSPYDAIARTPLGPVGLRMQGESLVEVGFPPADTPSQAPSSSAAAQALRQLLAYFADPRYVPDLPLSDRGTPFQRRVWAALRGIPSGQVRTYGELARALDSAPRAVGGACRANPCPILVPCHRVVAVRGKGGYAGATTGPWMAIKEELLRHEGVVWPP